MLTTWLTRWSFIHVFRAFPHTASTGWSKVLLGCQSRTSDAVCCSSAYVNGTDECALAPCGAKWKPGRGAEQPIFIQGLLLSPGQKQVNEVNTLMTSKMRLTLIPSALWGGEAILYTVKETSKNSRETRDCGGIKAPAGEKADLKREDNPTTPFSLLSSGHYKTQIHRPRACNVRTAKEEQMLNGKAGSGNKAHPSAGWDMTRHGGETGCAE